MSVWTYGRECNPVKHFRCLAGVKSQNACSLSSSHPLRCESQQVGGSGASFATPRSVHRILQARILEGVAIPFSRKSSRPRDWTQVFCIAGRFFTIWANRVVQCQGSIRRRIESICCYKSGVLKMCGGCTVTFQSLSSNRIDVFLRLCQ